MSMIHNSKRFIDGLIKAIFLTNFYFFVTTLSMKFINLFINFNELNEIRNYSL